jgi:N-acetylmuramoyl-L-alanine amidase
MNLNHSLHKPNSTRYLHPLLTALLIISLTWLTLLCLANTAWADTGVIKGSVVNIRSGPGTNHEIVGTIYEGTQVTISQKQGDWYKISVGNTSGWVASSLITAQSSAKVTVTGTTVNLRSGPGTNYGVVGQVSKGDTLTLINTEGDWYKVKTSDGKVSYIATSLASKADAGSTAPSQTHPPTQPSVSGKQVQVVSGPINVRSGPGTNYDKVGTIPDQGVFPVVNTQGDWHKIRLTDGTNAWVAAWLVKEVTGTSTAPTTPAPSTPGTGTSTTPVVNLDGKRLNFEVAPIIENDRTLVPLRAIFEAMGAHVEWDASTNTVTATRDGVKVVLTIGSTQPTVDGKVWNLDVPAKIVKDRTLAPLRFVGEAFGGKVGWDQATYTVTMTSPASKGIPTTAIVNHAAVNLRSGPNSTFGKVALAEPGEKLTVVGERDGWYEVSRGGTRGWVASWVVDVAWEANEPIPDPNLPPAEETPETPPTKPDKPGEDVIWLSCEKSESGYIIGIESGDRIDAKIKERSSEVVYTIKNREVEGKYLFEETLGTSKLTIKGTQDGDDAIVTISFPSGTEYRTASELGGKKETLIVPNFIQKVDRKAFSSNGERLIITTALPVKYSAQQKGDRLEVTLEGVVLGKADDKYTFKDSDLIDSVRFEATKDSTLITVNTTDLGKYSLGLGGSQGNEFNIMLVNKSAVKSRQDNLVVIDPGHGGNDTGARGTQVDEKVLNLKVALMVGDILQENGVDVEYTRDDDSTVGLERRAEIANALNAGLFVSIHHNSTTTSDKAGTETYFYAPPENPTLFMQKDERQKLASEIHKKLIQNLRRTDRGVKQSNFSVLRNTQMPSALAEICFISNPDEQSQAMKTSFQEQAAQAIADGILAYMGK